MCPSQILTESMNYETKANQNHKETWGLYDMQNHLSIQDDSPVWSRRQNKMTTKLFHTPGYKICILLVHGHSKDLSMECKFIREIAMFRGFAVVLH